MAFSPVIARGLLTHTSRQRSFESPLYEEHVPKPHQATGSDISLARLPHLATLTTKVEVDVLLDHPEQN